MRNNLKKILILILCVPTILLCSCGQEKPKCKAVDSSYYFQNEITCSLFNNSNPKTIKMDSISKSKVNLDTLDKYAKFTFIGNSAVLYHFYIEYISFKVYTNEKSEYDLDININLTNVIKESDIKNTEITDKTFSNTYSYHTKANGSFQVYAKINRVVSTATGSTLTIDALNSDMFVDSDSNFKWTIFDFKIHGESRTY